MNGRISLVDPKGALALLTGSSPPAALDVRSEGEFAIASFPGFVNLPILNDSERHLVGLEYKRFGPERAQELGHRLVDPERATRSTAWQKHLKSGHGTGLVMCWRGGLRSQISQAWIKKDSGLDTLRIEGGYKALRAEVLRSIEALGSQSAPVFWVISGMTGSGKTELLTALRVLTTTTDVLVLDLEALARHRGSSFGSIAFHAQPTQARFENELGLALWPGAPLVIVEDESALIGKIKLPEALSKKIQAAPVIELVASNEERVKRIHQEYVLEPLLHQSPAELLERLSVSLKGISKKLGGQRHAEIQSQLTAALTGSTSPESIDPHREWISSLLQNYYDPRYHYGSKLGGTREVLFKGDHSSCLKWIQNQFDSRKPLKKEAVRPNSQPGP